MTMKNLQSLQYLQVGLIPEWRSGQDVTAGGGEEGLAGGVVGRGHGRLHEGDVEAPAEGAAPAAATALGVGGVGRQEGGDEDGQEDVAKHSGVWVVFLQGEHVVDLRLARLKT